MFLCVGVGVCVPIYKKNCAMCSEYNIYECKYFLSVIVTMYNIYSSLSSNLFWEEFWDMLLLRV